MQSTTPPESDRKQAEWAITAAAWGGLAAADRVSIWASIHVRDMIGTNNLELRLLDGQPFIAPEAVGRTMHYTCCPGGYFSNVSQVPLPAELCGLWFTLVELATDSMLFANLAVRTAHARLETCAQKLVVYYYLEHVRLFAELCGGSVLAEAKSGW